MCCIMFNLLFQCQRVDLLIYYISTKEYTFLYDGTLKPLSHMKPINV